MKKILIIFMMLFCVISINNTIIINAEGEKNEEIVSKYETWGSDLSEEELIQYYIDNGIRPANAPAGSGTRLHYSDVSPKNNYQDRRRYLILLPSPTILFNP